jgi:CRP/FNR family transcriptional regulator
METLREEIAGLFPMLAEDAGLLDELDRSAIIRNFKRGDLVVDYGDMITSVPLVLDGVLKVLREHGDDKEVLLYFLEGGHTCAASFSCCMIKKRSEIKVIADADSRVVFIPLVTANNWMGRHEAWRDFVFSMYDERLFSMIDTIDRLAFAKLDQQLIDYLESRAQLTDDGVIRISHIEIATDLTASREAISRLLKKLEEEGRVELGRNRIKVLM